MESTTFPQPGASSPPSGGAKPRIVYILGANRSGTTLVGKVLSALPDSFFAGELQILWLRRLESWGYDHDPVIKCACHAPVIECDVWAPVLDALDVEARDPDEVYAWYRAMRKDYAEHKLLGGIPASVSPGTRRLIRDNALLYRRLSEVTGAGTIIDTSKSAAYGTALTRMPEDAEVYLLHITRDPRGIMHSRLGTRKRRGMETLKGRAHGSLLVRTCAHWWKRNLGADALCKEHPPERVLRLRYEDLIDRPRTAFNAVARWLGEEQDLPFVDERTVTLPPNHSYAANRNRREVGDVEIRRNRAWQDELDAADRRAITALTFPLLKRYGYALGTDRADS